MPPNARCRTWPRWRVGGSWSEWRPALQPCWRTRWCERQRSICRMWRSFSWRSSVPYSPSGYEMLDSANVAGDPLLIEDVYLVQAPASLPRLKDSIRMCELGNYELLVPS